MVGDRDVAAAAVICDADQVDWREALAVLRPHCAHVIFLTRNADERLWLDILQAGAFDLLAKPCRGEDLRWVVQSALHFGSSLKMKTAAGM